MLLTNKCISVILLIVILNINVKAQTKTIKGPIQYFPAEVYGGKVEFKRFVQQELHYPENALKNKIEGTVEVACLVDLKGNPSKMHIKKSVSPELDNEAIRLYKMLLFIPSQFLGGHTIRYSTLKFKFSANNYKRLSKKRSNDYYEIQDSINTTIYTDNLLKHKPKMIFEDSLENISNFIYKNLKYPEGTLRLNITGSVKLFFVVETSGRITNLKVVKDVGGGATNEAIRLLKMIDWQAGELNGQKVRVRKEFEVNFNLTSGSGMDYVPKNY